ncbi:carboxypeptidase-like regulatory domain-containing protein [Candidatus Methanodesulfokora washburnensis]|jgi:LEA14-like dessication related protein|uniref:Carboxypeptidase regulatory-like domain-containing protein n=1 Tax=Candidatus Methanodesulfokora washburnensis TaxID=2478471 RepID=A0A429GCV5_9CREN|nr:carboxypeptidase-like regulatory domain-containing protein [Candidatus Methanodesulfokores washburnensis]RSN71658.1 carboxypeptidase regulatory-like domain-containing protein [Candidatus Methanodesulfokores washburnensis]
MKKYLLKKKLMIFLIITSLSFSLSNVLGNDLKAPKVSMALQKVYVFPPGFSLDLTVKWKIYNPNNVTIFLKYIYFRVYINGKFINETAYFSEIEEELEKEWFVAPGQTKTIERTFTLDFPANEEIRKIVLEGKGEWSFEGTAFFSSSAGEVSAPIITEKSIVKYEGYGFTLSKIYLSPSTIRIEVKDENWLPITGAKVTLISKMTTFEGITNASGSVEFKVPTTNYTIRVSKEGYTLREELLELSAPSSVTKSIQLYPSKGCTKLIIEVKDVAGMIIDNAIITLFSKDLIDNFTKTTNVSGIAEFEIPQANYTLTVFKKGYLPHRESLDLSKSPIERKVIQLKPELTWLEQYRSYLIIGAIAICFIVSAVLRLKRKST